MTYYKLMQQSIKFKNRDQLELSGALHLPNDGAIIAYALFAHCFTCTKSINAAVAIANSLADRGIATLRFDFTGLGGSKGDFSDSNFSTNISDLVDAAEFLKVEFQAPQLLIGHSLGGTAILAASQQIESAKAVACIGSPSNPEHILQHLKEHLVELETSGAAEVKLAGRPFKFKQGFVDDVFTHKLDYRKLGKALMVMHSPHDCTVSIDEAGKIFSQAVHPKSFVSLDNADHLLSDKQDSQYAAEVLASWAMRYFDTPKVNLATHKGVSVSAETQHGFLCRVNANGHSLLADEPTSVGGSDLGPSPYDFLGAALASCTAMTLNMYARHKKIDLHQVEVSIEHARIHAEDCVDCEKGTGRVDVFNRDITLVGNLSAEQRARMLQIADRCPVHKTLENEIKITSQLNN
jgi:putative redox protein